MRLISEFVGSCEFANLCSRVKEQQFFLQIYTNIFSILNFSILSLEDLFVFYLQLQINPQSLTGGDKVDYGIGLSYWPASLCSLAGRYENPMPQSTLSPFRDYELDPPYWRMHGLKNQDCCGVSIDKQNCRPLDSISCI